MALLHVEVFNLLLRMLLNTFKHFLLGPGHKQPLSLLKEKITFGSITRSQQPKQAEQEQTDVSPQIKLQKLPNYFPSQILLSNT